MTEGRRMRKTRSLFDGTTVVDVYHDGLIVAEVEFDSTEEAAAFDPP